MANLTDGRVPASHTDCTGPAGDLLASRGQAVRRSFEVCCQRFGAGRPGRVPAELRPPSDRSFSGPRWGLMTQGRIYRGMGCVLTEL